jgi:uncharacterized peroxidase-related enzyme
MKCWIEHIPQEKATGRLAEVYDKVRTSHGQVDHVYLAQSLMPETILGHDTLYKAALHDEAHCLPEWFLELVGVYTSILNRCTYAVTHHQANMAFLLNDEKRTDRYMAALNDDNLESVFEPKEALLLRYAQKLTRESWKISRQDILGLRENGIADRELLEVNQVCACFNYTNRLLNGLGVELGDERIGFYGE